MPTGPQRTGFPNIVNTPHGQQLGRRSDTQYTHAVIRTEPIIDRRASLQRQVDFHQEMLAKYGEHNIDAHTSRRASKAAKELSTLPDTGHYSELVSMHQSEREASRRQYRMAGKGTGYNVVPVSQQ